MSNFPKVYSIEEQQERFLFQRFLQKHFILSKRATKTFAGELSVDVLLSLYKQNHPDTLLTPDIVMQMLQSGGFLNPQFDAVTLDLRSDAWETFQKEFQVAILKYIGDKTLRFKLGQLLYGVTVAPIAPVVMMDESIQRFIKTHLFKQSDFSYWYNLKSSQQKVGVSYAYWYYQKFCLQEEYTPVPRKQFISELTKIGGNLQQGYFNGQSGVPVIPKLGLPSRSYMDLSFELGLGVINVNGRDLFNDGRSVTSLSEEGLQAYIKGRRVEIFGEEKSEVKKIEEEGEPLIDRGNVEDKKVDVSSGEERAGQESSCEVSGASIRSSEGDVGQASEICNWGTNAIWCETENVVRDSRRSESTITEDARQDMDRRVEEPSADRDSGHECIDADSEDLIGTDTSGIQGNEDDFTESFGEKPSTKDIFATLKVPYKINPGAFDKEMMAEYLLMMHPSLRVEDYWDDFMKEMSR